MPFSFRLSIITASLLILALILFLSSCGGMECIPQCDGRNCGPDGCGSVCGHCLDGSECQDGTCYQACSDGLTMCEGICIDLMTSTSHCGECNRGCPPGELCESGNCSGYQCVPDCTGRFCGGDGCGGSCGTCDPGENCEDGNCVPISTCTPDCHNLDCGDDGCGGSCGTCPENHRCENGLCVIDQEPEAEILVAWESNCVPGQSTAPSQFNSSNSSSKLSAYGVRENSSHDYHTYVCFSDAFSTKYWNNTEYDEKYWMVSLSTTGFRDLNLSSKQNGTNTGPRDFTVQFSTDGNNWSSTGATITVSTDWDSGTIEGMQIPATYNNVPQLYIRWILIGQTSIIGENIGTTGPNRINHVIIEGFPM